MKKQERCFYEYLREHSSYSRNLNHNYLVFHKELNGEMEKQGDYAIRMMEENQIRYLLPMEVHRENGEDAFYYEVSSLQPIARIYESKTMSGESLLAVLREITKVFSQAREYLLPEEGLVLHQDFIYMNPETGELRFLYYPFQMQDYGTIFLELSEYFLDRIDHQDSEAVVMAYQFYKIVRNENFVLREIEEMCERQSVRKENKFSTQEASDACGNSSPQDSLQYPLKETEDQKEPVCRQKWKLPQKKQDGKMLKTQAALFLAITVIALACLLKNRGPVNSYRNIVSAGFFVFGLGGTLMSLLLKRAALQEEAGAQAPSGPENEWQQSDLLQKPENGSHLYADRKDAHQMTVDQIGKEEKRELVPVYGKTEFCLVTPEEEERVLVEKRHGKEILHKIIPLPFTIGKLRDMSDLYLPDTTVSRMHARIFEEEGRLYVMDLGSTNGTYLNGIGIGREEKMQLEAGDELRIGKTAFVYQ